MHKTERGWCVSVDERRIELKGDDVLLRCARAFSNTEASTTLMFRLTLPVIAVASATSLYFSAACMPSLVLPEPMAPKTWMAGGTKAQGREDVAQAMQGIIRHLA